MCGNVIPVDQGGYHASRVIPLKPGMRGENFAINSPTARGPVLAISKLLKRRNLTVDDIDYFEINLHAET